MIERRSGISFSATAAGFAALVRRFIYMISQTCLDPALPVPGIALIGHQTRRPLVLDPETGVPTLSERDQPFESFLESLMAAGLVHRVLGSLDAGGSAGPLFLLAIAWDETLVAALEPVPPVETP